MELAGLPIVWRDESALPESAVLSENVFDVYEEDAASSENDILGWLEEVGY